MDRGVKLSGAGRHARLTLGCLHLVDAVWFALVWLCGPWPVGVNLALSCRQIAID